MLSRMMADRLFKRMAISIIVVSAFLFCLADFSEAANIKVIPSATRVSPGENFYIDINVENIPSEGLGAVQFRLHIDAQSSTVAGVSDISQGKATDVSLATPLLIGPPTLTRSGIGDFFLSGAGPNGILVMDNETLANGSGLYTFGHTNGSTPPSGNGSVARFYFAVGKDVTAEKIMITLSDVMLLDTGVMYPLESNVGATIELRCITKVPNLLGLSRIDAQAALQGAGLLAGNIYEIDNQNKTYALNQVLTQSYAAGTSVLCETPVDLAINTAPSEVGSASAADKPNDESGGVILSWTPSVSSDASGYRVYLGSQLLTEIRNPSSTGTEISGLPNGQVSQIKITAFDTFGNESPGVIVSATAVDDVAPRITIDGVVEGAFYSSSVLPSINVIDSNLSAKEILLNGISYAMAAIGIEGNYTLKVTATDSSGNTTTREIHFVIDKTPPLISVSGVEKNRYYNTDIVPVITVTEPNLQNAEFLLNGSPFTSGSVIASEGAYELKVDVSDKAGNRSTDTYVFYIDKTKPVSSITVGDPRFEQGGDIFVSGSTAFTLTGRDEGVIASGISKLEYSLNNSGWSIYQSLFTLSGLPDGNNTINYRATDVAGNIEPSNTLSVRADNTPPITAMDIGTPKFTGADGTVYITPLTDITLSASDLLSGVMKTEYRIGNGQWITYAPFRMTGEGRWTVYCRSTDNMGNTETEKSQSLVIDSTPPVTDISTGEPKFVSSDGKLSVSGNTRFTLNASESLSGVSLTEYMIDSGQWTSYASPFALSSDGNHTIEYRSRDNVGNIETAKSLSVIMDNTPPSTNISIGDPKSIISGITYVTKDTNFTLSASDNVSGVSKTEYRIDDGAWTIYAPFNISSEGAHIIYYRSTDNVGNIEDAKTLTVVIDSTPPVTDISAGQPKYVDQSGKTYATKDTIFTLSATDNLSGVALIEYRLDNGAWQSYSPFTINAEGSHFVEYRSKDNVGNQELTKSLSIIVDSTPPSTEISIGEPKYIDSSGALYVTKDTIFTLGASDNLSGISVTEYNINTGEWTLYAQFKLNAEGMHTIYYRSKDNVGNTETEKVLTAVIDNTPPSSEITIGVPKYIDQSGKAYATKDAVFTITATDSASGVAKAEYRLDNGVWMTYAPFSIPSEGDHTIEYRSTDNVGNVEAFKALKIIIDNSAPSTEISAGEPKYISADGKLYVTGGTAFTLSPSDNLSGVSKTEYRLDVGQWQVYAPFKVTSDGAHTIGYRSIDNLGNTETEKTLSIILDNTSPSSAISVGDPKHQTSENLYISASTEITIISSDTGSGIMKTEYKIDGGAFISYALLITLASYSEGNHTVFYRSIDNLGNTEDTKTLVVTVDKTPPQTSLTASDPLTEGLVNTVSPKTRFALKATDNLSGVEEIQYRIDNGAWKQYLANFSLSGLAAGEHTIAYKATDNVINEEAEKSLTVTLVVIDVSKSISTEPVVLAGAWWHHEYDHDDNSDGNGNGSDRGNWDYDGDDGIRGTQNAFTNLLNMLASSGLSYYISEDDNGLKSAIRSGRFNTYVFVDFKNEDIGDELREAVNYGAGLVFIKTKPFADPELDDVFGVKFTGMTTDSGLDVGLMESPICREGTFRSRGKSVVANITSGKAQIFGHESDRHEDHPAVIYTEYGRGKVILFNFNLLNTDELGKAKELLMNSIDYVKPSGSYLTALGSVPITINLNNSTEPVDVQVMETLPYGSTVDSISPSALQTDGTITWQKYLNMREKTAFRYYLNLPDSGGEYTVNTEVRYSNNGEYRLYGNYSLTLNVQNNSSELKQDVITDLRKLIPANIKDAEKIYEAINEISKINSYASTRKDAEDNIERILEAIDELLEVSIDISSVRLKLDELLMIWEKKWYYMKQ